jgi:hypothetical protein
MQSLAGYWSEFFDNCRRPPYIHSEDGDDKSLDDYLKRKPHLRDPLSFNAFVNSQRFDPKDEDFHFSLLPVPYVGNLAKADIFILLLNPGFAPSDYYGESENRSFKRALQQNLEQDFHGMEYPFLYLDPRFCWHGGYRWWEAKLRDVVQTVAKEQYRGRYVDALKAVSRRVAAIDLVPYHSAHFRTRPEMTDLPSAAAAREWVHNSLVSRAKRGKVVLVVTRKTKVWDIKPIRDLIICYSASEAIAAHLTSNSRGGKTILKRLRS